MIPSVLQHLLTHAGHMTPGRSPGPLQQHMVCRWVCGSHPSVTRPAARPHRGLRMCLRPLLTLHQSLHAAERSPSLPSGIWLLPISWCSYPSAAFPRTVRSVEETKGDLWVSSVHPVPDTGLGLSWWSVYAGSGVSICGLLT